MWVCRGCHSGAVTLPILRRVAPRQFVNQVWQAALKNGRVSATRCPSCTQPFTTFIDSAATVEPRLEVCTRCHWVWLSPTSMAALSGWRQQIAANLPQKQWSRTAPA